MVKCINCNDTKTIQYPDELFERPCPACVPRPQEAAEPLNEHVTDSLKYALSASLARAGHKLAMSTAYGDFSDKLPTIAFIALDTGELIKRADGDQTNNLHIPLCRKDIAETLLVMQNPVPEVPELVRYSGADIAWGFGSKAGIKSDANGEYVRYDQAAEIIAAKADHAAKQIGEFAARAQDDVNHWKQRAEAAEAKLEQYEAQAQVDYFDRLVNEARLAAAKATAKFPQPNYVLLKIAEEAGEVVRGGVHYAENRMGWDEVEGEIVQLLAMIIRFITEGDQVIGITPPDPNKVD